MRPKKASPWIWVAGVLLGVWVPSLLYLAEAKARIEALIEGKR
jgi:hypothetical protein